MWEGVAGNSGEGEPLVVMVLGVGSFCGGLRVFVGNGWTMEYQYHFVLGFRSNKVVALQIHIENHCYVKIYYTFMYLDASLLTFIRENTNHWKIKKINATEQRSAGYCPLTPKEVGVFIQALGYPSSTLIYIAAGEIYGGARRLSDLTVRFPNVVFKETLATQDELEAFSGHASQTAAIDYIISVESNVFIPSHSGNMARAVEGHRRFLGHRKTITPDRQGAPRKRGGPPSGIKGRARLRYEESFYQNPFPECIWVDDLMMMKDGKEVVDSGHSIVCIELASSPLTLGSPNLPPNRLGRQPGSVLQAHTLPPS
ncbi:hypothetical protein KSS87_011225 [Heliosperma pusillum]|nr:hypothetical protein KSS87_011225 [Heliosperma pusillum]